jgi:hypothetical protein
VIIAVWLLSETLYFAFHTTRSYGDAGLKDAKLGSESLHLLLPVFYVINQRDLLVRKSEPNQFLRRSWRVGQGRLDIVKRPPGTEGSQYYYADGEEMKERASIV